MWNNKYFKPSISITIKVNTNRVKYKFDFNIQWFCNLSHQSSGVQCTQSSTNFISMFSDFIFWAGKAPGSNIAPCLLITCYRMILTSLEYAYRFNALEDLAPHLTNLDWMSTWVSKCCRHYDFCVWVCLRLDNMFIPSQEDHYKKRIW